MVCRGKHGNLWRVKKTIIVGQKERVGAWVAARVGQAGQWANFEAIGLEQSGELVAGVVFDSYVAGARCSMHVAGERGTWLNRGFLQACFRYAFDKMGCRVVIGLVNADNPQALRFDLHLGFKEIARIPNGSGDCDLVVLAMQRDACRWLNILRGQ